MNIPKYPCGRRFSKIQTLLYLPAIICSTPLLNSQIIESLTTCYQLGYAKVPSIVVEGDVEDKLNEDWHKLFNGLPTTILDPSDRTFWKDWEIIGLTRNDSMYGRVLNRTNQERFTIIIGHNPNFAIQRPEADLYLAGHTHGGQVNLPWIGPLITFSDVPNDQAQGRSELDNGATLIVSRGIGMERVDAPRIRFMCAPEIVVIDVLPE